MGINTFCCIYALLGDGTIYHDSESLLLIVAKMNIAIVNGILLITFIWEVIVLYKHRL